MSLISVMIAIGISGVLVMVVTQIYQQMQNVAFYATAQSDLQDGMGTFALHLAQDSNCSCNFTGQTFNSAAATLSNQSLSVPSIQKFDGSCASPQPLVAVGSELAGVRRLKVSSLKMANFQPLGSAAPPTSYTSELLVSFDSGSTALGIPILTRKVPIQVNVSDSGGTATVQSCTVIGKDSGSLISAANLTEFFEAMDGKKAGVVVCYVDSNEHRCMDDAGAVGLIFEYYSDGLVVKFQNISCDNNSCDPPSGVTFPKVTVADFESQTFPTATHGGQIIRPTDFFTVIMDPIGGGVAINGAYRRAIEIGTGACPDAANAPGSSYMGWLMSPARSTLIPPGSQATVSDSEPSIRSRYPGVELYVATVYQTGVSTMACPPLDGGG